LIEERRYSYLEIKKFPNVRKKMTDEAELGARNAGSNHMRSGDRRKMPE
jgi:hypothetical protein